MHVPPAAQPVVPAAAPIQSVTPLPITATPQAQTHGAIAQVLMSAAQLLSLIDGISAPVLPTAPCAPADMVQNALTELKQQINAVAALVLTGAVGKGTKDKRQSGNPSLGPKSPAASAAGTGKVTEHYKRNRECMFVGSRWARYIIIPWGKLVSHVPTDVKDRIWKGEFLDIFLLIRAKRREVDQKDKEGKGSSLNDKKPKMEESITNWLLGFNVYMNAMIEKKSELAPSKRS
ncbi:hypothetical protein NDU88_003333 [Pleurodeles waltl]|uniref:Uncharacterized protein n=1 Tax=Pleurodeles waltl TaxID=8319 RepID=A0AAV7UC91_PLEWA|nr:hypothetical protein NDU88_003333 [Pleurodeles waltl]